MTEHKLVAVMMRVLVLKTHYFKFCIVLCTMLCHDVLVIEENLF